MSIKSTPNCLLFNNSCETLVHLFCVCQKVVPLWKDLENWVQTKTDKIIEFTVPNILLGYLKPEYHVPVNTIILATKKYIFSASRKNQNLNIVNFKLILKRLYDDHYSISKSNSQADTFEKNWATFNVLFNE